MSSESANSIITCSICLDPLSTSDTYTLQCHPDHTFHRSCITTWLNQHSTCPLCRSNVKPERIYVDDGIIDEDRYQELIDSCKELLDEVGNLIEEIIPPSVLSPGFHQHLHHSINQGNYDSHLNRIINPGLSSDNQPPPTFGLLFQMFMDGIEHNLNNMEHNFNIDDYLPNEPER